MSTDQVAFIKLYRLVGDRFGYTSKQRVRHLTGYESEWDGNNAVAPLRSSAIEMKRFIQETESFATRPSFFLSIKGYFAMAWEDSKGNRIDKYFNKQQRRENTA